MAERVSVYVNPAQRPATSLRWVRMGDLARERTRPAYDSSGTTAPSGDARLVRALRDGDEAAFTSLVTSYYPAMVRVALMYVPNRAVAEEVIQQTWLGVLQGIQRFEGRSSLKTWIFRILMNVARTYGQREGRSIPFSSLAELELGSAEAAVDAERFRPGDDLDAPGGWVSTPRNWDDLPEQRMLSQEIRALIDQAIEALPPAQREVILLRDVEGFGTEEVSDLLGISQGNQRVLLHRARSKVRRALEEYLSEV